MDRFFEGVERAFEEHPWLGPLVLAACVVLGGLLEGSGAA